MSTKLVKQCVSCHAEGKMKRCAGCDRAYYCSGECQRADWPTHKGWCKRLVNPHMKGVRDRFIRLLRDQETGIDVVLLANELLKLAPAGSVLEIEEREDGEVCYSVRSESEIEGRLGATAAAELEYCHQYWARGNEGESEHFAVVLVANGEFVTCLSINKLERADLRESIADAGGMRAIKRAIQRRWSTCNEMQ